MPTQPREEGSPKVLGWATPPILHAVHAPCQVLPLGSTGDAEPPHTVERHPSAVNCQPLAVGLNLHQLTTPHGLGLQP